MITEYIFNFATNLISTLGYGAIIFLTAVESALVPIPPEVTVVFSGFLSYSGRFNLALVIILAFSGSILGSSIAYATGYHFKKLIVTKLISKKGHFLSFTEEDIEKVQKLLKQHGFWFITVARFIPGVRSVISLVLGILHVPYRQFITYTALGSALSITSYAVAGYYLGNNWQTVRLFMRKFDILILAIGILLIATYFYKRHHKKSR